MPAGLRFQPLVRRGPSVDQFGVSSMRPIRVSADGRRRVNGTALPIEMSPIRILRNHVRTEEGAVTQTEARELAREITGAMPVSNGHYRWGVILPDGKFVTDASSSWTPSKMMSVWDLGIGHQVAVRRLFIDNRDDGVLCAITERGSLVRVDGVPWQLVVAPR
jgi:hypothetical protein